VNTSRFRPRLATTLAVGLIGALSLGLTLVGSADAGSGRTTPPPVPNRSGQPAATMVIHQSSGEDITTEVSSLQVGVGVGVSNSGPGPMPSNPQVSEMVVTRTTDSNSPVLFSYITQGTRLYMLTLTGALPDGTPVEYVLENVILSGFSTAAGGADWSESLSLNFAKITTTVGPNSATYNLATNTTS
jgi:type VI protein secretion system component Hcp